MRSFHTVASTHDQISALSLCALCSPLGHYRRLAFALPRCVAHASTFLPPVPRRSFAVSASRGTPRRCGTMKALTPAPLTYGAGLPTYLATPSCRSVSNHVGCLDIASPPRQRVQRVSDFAMECAGSSQLPAESSSFILRTDSSPPVALHPASRRRSYLRLRSCGILRHGLSST